MTKDFFSDGVLVYDRYYCSKPVTPLLVIKKILLAALFCGSSFAFIVTELGFPVSAPLMAGAAAALCCAFCAVFTFVRKRFAVPAILLVGGAAVWLSWESLAGKLSYFADACMLSVEGRFLYPRRFLFHRGEILDALNVQYAGGVLTGALIMCAIYSLIISACFSGRLVPVPAALLFVALCVPALISESLEFSLWLIPALGALAGLVAIRKNYSGGLAVKHSSASDYRRRLRHEERTFMRRIRSAPFLKRTEMKCNFYSKYFSVGMYCAALAAVCVTVGAAIIPAGGSIDYSGVYDFVTSLTDISGDGGSQSPFEQGAASEYFAHGGKDRQDTLNIIAPGRGEREIIRVDYTGERPFYLRGDIGIDFSGTSWTTAVSSEPQLWSSSGLKDTYRPCEGRVIAALLSLGSMTEYGDEDTKVISTADVTIDYLCDTNVVFLPAYTAEFSFYNNDSFDVFADYAVRVSESAGGHVNSVRCTALVPAYTSNETSLEGAEYVSLLDRTFEDAGCTPNDIYASVIPEMTTKDVLSDYGEYVRATYLGIPGDYREDISDYIGRNLPDLAYLIGSNGCEDVTERYLVANQVSNYLRENYTYSLDGSNNSRNPVMQFLDDTKRGHCSLYASAMTLILRDLGIPARYCTGFYVDGNGGNSVLLREKNLHAWVEVYLGEYGWVTFDPTSSAAYPGRNQQNSGVQSETAETRPEKPAESRPEIQPGVLPARPTDEPETTAETAGTAESAPAAPTTPAEPGLLERAAPFIPIAAAVIAVLAAAVILVTRYMRLKKRARSVLESLRTGEPALCAGQIYRLILDLLAERGVTPSGGEMPGDFFRRADEAFGCGLSERVGLLEKMEFGSGNISDEERGDIYDQLERILAAVKPFSSPGSTRKTRLLRIICNCPKKS